MSTRRTPFSGAHASWLATVSVVTLLATLAITIGTKPESKPSARRPRTTAGSVLAPLGATSNRPVVAANYGKLPLSFEPAAGAGFVSRGAGYNLFLSGGEAVLSLRRPSANRNSKIENRKSALAARNSSLAPETLRMKLLGANAQAAVKGVDKLPGVTNYYIGNDPKKWRTGVANYAKVHYDEVYPGVDLVYYGNQRQLEYDFVVAPGASPSTITLSFEGSKNENRKTKIEGNGDLVITADGGEVRFHKPVVYQEFPTGHRAAVDGQFKMLAANRVGFEVGGYDKTRALVIDPTLTYGTYLGGDSFDMVADVKVDVDGNAYVVGTAGSDTFPTVGGGGPFGGGFGDAYVAKLDPTGASLIYSTFIGGSGFEDGTGIAFNTDPGPFGGGLIIVGNTDSHDFPSGTDTAGGNDAFIAKISGLGLLDDVVFFGGTGQDGASRVATDGAGHIYLTGPTNSEDLTLLNEFQPTCGCVGNGLYDAYVAVFDVFDADGPALLYSSYLGGAKEDYPHGIAVDSTGKVFVIGSTDSDDFPTNPPETDPDGGTASDAFLTFIDPTQSGTSAVLGSYYLGDAGSDYGYAVAVDSSDKVYVAGHTDSATGFIAAPGFDTDNAGGLDVYVAKFDPATSTPVYGTFIGGSMGEQVTGLAVGADGSAYVTGFTSSSTDFPLNGAVDSTFGSGFNTAFVTKIDPTGQLTYPFSSFLGGDGGDVGQSVAVDASGNVYVVGITNSTDFPGTSGKAQPACGDAGCTMGDGFVAKIQLAAVSGPQLTALPGSLSFGNVATATTSTKVVQIKNTGTTTLNLSTIAISGTDAASFAINAGQTSCTNSTTLAANSACNIAIDFSPVAEVGYSASLDVASNDATSPAHIALAGTGAPAIPGISVNPTSLSFGNVTVDTSSTKIVTVTNDGTAPTTISVSGITITQSGTEYAIAAGTTCVPGTPIAVDASCTIGITLTPGSATTFTGTLNIVSDAPSSPTQIALSGTGMVSAAKIDVSPASLDFGTAQVGSVINYPVTVTNTGTEDLIISAITVSGPDASKFTSPAAGSTCTVGGHIVPNASCVITTDFNAAAIATYNATLTITSNAANAPTASGPLTGKGSDFQFAVQSGGSLTATVNPGETASFPLSIGGTPGAAGTATLGCVETIPNAICGVSPTSVTLNDTTPSNFLVTVVTLNSAGSLPGPTPGGPMSMPPSWVWLLAAVLMLGMMVKTQRRTRLAMVAAMLMVMLWSSCVGNAPRPVASNITPAGTYNVGVTATVNGVTKTQTVVVTVN